MGRAEHPLLQQLPVDPRGLANWPWILYPPSTAVRKVSEDIFERAGMQPGDVVTKIDGKAIDLASHQSQMKAKYDEKLKRNGK